MEGRSRLRAVAFDVDGTLYPESSIALRCVDLFFGQPRIFMAFSTVRKEIRFLQAQPNYIPRNMEELHSLQVSLLAKRLKMDESHIEQSIEKIFYHLVPERFSSIHPYRGTRQAIEAIRQNGLIIAALSDLPPQEKLQFLGLHDLFDYKLCAEEWGVLKPHQRAFDGMVKTMHVQPFETLYVGNNIEYDIRGAKKAGLRAALRGRQNSAADLSFSNWEELTQWVLAHSY